MSESICGLAGGKCRPCDDRMPALTGDEIGMLLPQLKGWQVAAGRLRRDFRFADHCMTMAFVNAIAWISHRQDHHPELTVGYNTCRVEYVTHAINGLSQNDFICAAKIDALFEL